MKKKSKWEWLYRILALGLFDKFTEEAEHWHPATKIPPFGKEIVVWCKDLSTGEIVAQKAVYGGSGFEGCGVEVLYWCYPPKEE